MKRFAVLVVGVPLLSTSLTVGRPPTGRILHQHQQLWFYVNGPTVDASFLANGATLFTSVNGKSQGYTVKLPDTGKVVRLPLAWNLPAGPQKFLLRATAGTLDIRRWFTPGGRVTAGALPLLAVYGDSIALGMTTGGPGGYTGGWADQMAPALQRRVVNLSVGFTSAACFGKNNAQRVAGAAPDAVVIAFGVNDMIPGMNGWGCNTTLAGFVAGMHTILSTTDPLAVPVFVSAILPTGRVPEGTRTEWNAALADEVSEHSATFINPSVAVDYPTDFAGTLHPDQGGHDKLAAFWSDVLAA